MVLYSRLTVLVSLLLTGSSIGLAQVSPSVRFQTGKPLCLLHFLHTAIGGEHSSQTYRAHIDSVLTDPVFREVVSRYQALDFSAGYRRPNVPRRRYRSRTVMDFLWLHSAASTSQEAFSQRIVGLLPVAEHVELFAVLTKAEPFYDRLVWHPEQANIARTDRFLNAYADRVGQLFHQVSRFYGTPWPASIPFTVALCPIPLASGVTSAVPKTNVLVCSYLSRNDEDYQATLGVAVHEMCHSLYDEQPTGLQQDIDDWFTLSQSPQASYAYGYFNEALATAIGNGWAYEQLNGKRDTAAWYADAYIDGFARAIHPLVVAYLREGQQIDRAFVRSAIEAFAKTYPEAHQTLDILLNSVGMYADTEDDELLSAYTNAVLSRFRVSSSFLRAPLSSPGAQRSFGYPQLTKLILVDRDRSDRWQQLAQRFDALQNLEMPTEENVAYPFYDRQSKSPVLLFLVSSPEGFDNLLSAYAREGKLRFGESLSVQVSPGEHN